MESMTKLFKEHLVGTWTRRIASELKEKVPTRHTQEEFLSLDLAKAFPDSCFRSMACLKRFTYLEDDMMIDSEGEEEGTRTTYCLTVVGSAAGECTLVALIDSSADYPETAFCRMSFSDDWSYLLLEDMDGNGRFTYYRVEENE